MHFPRPALIPECAAVVSVLLTLVVHHVEHLPAERRYCFEVLEGADKPELVGVHHLVICGVRVNVGDSIICMHVDFLHYYRVY